MSFQSLDDVYGKFQGMSSSQAYGTGNATPAPVATLDPSTTERPTRAVIAPDRPIHDEPGAGKATAPKTILDNPTTWLIVTFALAIIAGRIAATGKVL